MKSTCLAALAALAAMVAAPSLAAQATAPTSAAMPLAAPAKLAYTTLGYKSAWGSGWYNVGGPVWHRGAFAAPFVAGVSGSLDYIDLPLQLGSVVVSLYADLGGAPATYNAGPPMEEWLDEKLGDLGPGKVVKFVSKQHPSLTAGTTYWVVVAPLFYDSLTKWPLNVINVVGVDGSVEGGWQGSWAADTTQGGLAPAFDVWVQ